MAGFWHSYTHREINDFYGHGFNSYWFSRGGCQLQATGTDGRCWPRVNFGAQSTRLVIPGSTWDYPVFTIYIYIISYMILYDYVWTYKVIIYGNWHPPKRSNSVSRIRRRWQLHMFIFPVFPTFQRLSGSTIYIDPAKHQGIVLGGVFPSTQKFTPQHSTQ